MHLRDPFHADEKVEMVWKPMQISPKSDLNKSSCLFSKLKKIYISHRMGERHFSVEDPKRILIKVLRNPLPNKFTYLI